MSLRYSELSVFLVVVLLEFFQVFPLCISVLQFTDTLNDPSDYSLWYFILSIFSTQALIFPVTIDHTRKWWGCSVLPLDHVKRLRGRCDLCSNLWKTSDEYIMYHPVCLALCHKYVGSNQLFILVVRFEYSFGSSFFLKLLQYLMSSIWRDGNRGCFLSI